MDPITAMLAISTTLFMIAFVSSAIKIKKMSKVFTKMYISQTMIEELVDKTNHFDKIKRTENEIHKENFIKFLSDSREWAYEYIDTVQKELKSFIDIADKEFAYFDTYGILTSGYPNYEAMTKISKEYKKLKKLLPEETDDRR